MSLYEDCENIRSRISGHTAAFHLKRLLSNEHEIVVVSPNSKMELIPSNIWVGIGDMKEEDVTFELRPVYQRMGIILFKLRPLKFIQKDFSLQQNHL